MFDRSGTVEYHDRVTPEHVKLAFVLGSDPGEEGGQPVIVRLAVRLVRMMVAASALDAHAEKDLGRGFGEIGRRAGDSIVIGRSVLQRRSLGGDDLADKLVDGYVLPQRPSHPVEKAPHAADTRLFAIVSQQIAPLQRPVGTPRTDVQIAFRVAGET